MLVENSLIHGRGRSPSLEYFAKVGYALRVCDQGSIQGDPDVLFERRSAVSSKARGGIGLSLARTLASAEGARLSMASADPTSFELLFAFARSPDVVAR